VEALRTERRGPLGRRRRFEEAEAGVHQPICLAREGGGEQRVAFRVPRHFLRERNEFLTAERTTTLSFGHFSNDRKRRRTAQPEPFSRSAELFYTDRFP